LCQQHGILTVMSSDSDGEYPPPRRISATVTVPLDTPGARENAAMLFGYPDWRSLLDAAGAGSS
jgi:hypothetical protein